MNAVAQKRRYFVMVNRYRSSTDSGFANTWSIRECHSKAQQARILKHGLPCRDSAWQDSDGRRHPTYSTLGVRAATASELRSAKQEELLGGRIDLTDHHVDVVDG